MSLYQCECADIGRCILLLLSDALSALNTLQVKMQDLLLHLIIIAPLVGMIFQNPKLDRQMKMYVPQL